MTGAHEGTSPLWTDIRIENRLDTLDFIEHKDICYVDYGEVADFIEDEIRDDYEAALAERDARIKELEQEVRELEESCHSLGAALSGTESAWEEIESLMLGEDA
jgi:cell division septum initiation protein DivIVA